MTEYAYVYILSNSFRKLYIGITTHLETRIAQHKNKTNPNCHIAKYSIDKLVYYERFTLVTAAIRREKVLKGWLRRRKLELIITTNPLWKDLSEDWGKPTEPFNERDLRPPQTFPKNLSNDNAGVLHFVQDDSLWGIRALRSG